MIDNGGKGRGRTRKIEIGHGWVIGAISLALGCDETSAIWGWVRWCDLGLDAVVQSGVVVCARVGCGGAIWGCGVRDITGSTLSSCSWFGSFFFLFFFFFFWKWFEGKLGDGFWTVGWPEIGDGFWTA